MKKLKIFTGLVILCLFLIQTSEAADTLRIHVTIKHLLNNSGQPYNYRTISQQFYTPEGLFFREINYNDSTGELSGYSFLFYKDNRVFTREFYDLNNNLLYIQHHTYDNAGNEKILTQFIPGEAGKLKIAEKKVNVYKAQRLVQCKKFNGKRLSSLTRYIFNEEGKLLQEKTVYKKSTNAPAKQEIRDYSYSADGKIESVALTSMSWDAGTTQTKEAYKYDKDGRLNSVKQFNSQGTAMGEKTYKYLKTGEISGYEEFDSRGVKTLMLQYEYKKNFMEMGVQKSKYENL